MHCFPRQNSIVSLFIYQRGRIRKYIKARFPVGCWTTVLSPWLSWEGAALFARTAPLAGREAEFTASTACTWTCHHNPTAVVWWCLQVDLHISGGMWCKYTVLSVVHTYHCWSLKTCLLLTRIRYNQQAYIAARAQIASHKTCFCLLIFCSTLSLTFSSQLFLPR